MVEEKTISTVKVKDLPAFMAAIEPIAEASARIARDRLLETAIAALDARIAALEAAPAPADHSAEIAALQSDVTALQNAVAALQSAPPPPPEATPTVINVPPEGLTVQFVQAAA